MVVAINWADYRLMAPHVRDRRIAEQTRLFFRDYQGPPLSTPLLAGYLLRGAQPKDAAARLSSVLVKLARRMPDVAKQGEPEDRRIYGRERIVRPWLWAQYQDLRTLTQCPHCGRTFALPVRQELESELERQLGTQLEQESE